MRVMRIPGILKKCFSSQPHSSHSSNISSSFQKMFRTEFPKSWIRTVGREAEYPVVWADGSAADVRLLLAEIGKDSRFIPTHEGDFDRLLSVQDTTQLAAMTGSTSKNGDDRVEYLLEVGWGTVEIVLGPCPDLFELERQHERAMFRLIAAANKLGMNILGYGIQPRTGMGDNLMSPRNRYTVMKNAIGPAWESFTVTASDQLHVDVIQEEAIPFTNICNLLTPVVVALCSNSPIYEGTTSKYLCAREGLMRECGADHYRHGIPKGACTDFEHFIESLGSMPFLMSPSNDNSGRWEIPKPRGNSFLQHLTEQINANENSSNSSEDAATDLDQMKLRQFLAHEHYVWHATRPRCRQSTVELRAACQQPWNEHMAAAALQLGMVEAASQGTLQQLFDEQTGEFPFQGGADGKDCWNAMRSWNREVVSQGLAPLSKEATHDNTTDNTTTSIDDVVQKICIAGQNNNVQDMWSIVENVSNSAGIQVKPEILMGVAFHAASNDMDSIKQIFKEQGIGASSELDAPALIRRVLELCSDGLKARGLGEEIFMEPLFTRLDKGANPAEEVLKAASDGGMQALIEHAKIRI